MNKKSFLLLPISLLILASCSNTPKGDEPDTPVTPETPAWSDAVNAKSLEVLGHYLPYMDIGDYTFDYDEDYEVWEIYNTTAPISKTTEYSELLAGLEGYEVLEIDESDIDAEEDPSSYYAYVQVLQDDDEATIYNYVDVQYAFGTFYIDFMRYEFTITNDYDDEMKAAMRETFGFVLPFPGPLSSSASIDLTDGVFTIEDSAEEYATVLELATNFCEGLEELEFEGTTSTNTFGDFLGEYYLATGEKVEVSGQECDVAIQASVAATNWEDFDYTSDLEIEVALTYLLPTSAEWPADAIEDFLGDTHSPVYQITGTNYSSMLQEDEEGEESLFISVNGVEEDDLVDYFDALALSAYDVYDYGWYALYYGYDALYQVTPWAEDYIMIVGLADANVEIYLYVNEPAEILSAFPTNDINEALDYEGLPTLPTFTSAEGYGYKFYVSSDGYAVAQGVDDLSGSLTLAEQYAAALESAEFTVVYDEEYEMYQATYVLSETDTLSAVFYQTGVLFTVGFTVTTAEAE